MSQPEFIIVFYEERYTFRPSFYFVPLYVLLLVYFTIIPFFTIAFCKYLHKVLQHEFILVFLVKKVITL